MDEFPINTDALWASVSNREAKEAIAKEIVSRAKDGEIIGFGSGTTAMVCALEFGKAVKSGLNVSAVVTSLELEWLCKKLGIELSTTVVGKVDWCFDGADEVDPNGNLLKGRGGAMHRERQVFRMSEKRLVVADPSKDVEVLGEKFPAPIEVEPMFVIAAIESLKDMNFDSVDIRTGSGKDGPVITETGNVIVDVVNRSGFDDNLVKQINEIEGVFDTGLFMGFEFERLS